MLAGLKARLFRRDEPGLLVAGAAHAGLLVAAVVGLANAPPSFADAQEALPVEVISAAQLAAMTRGEKTAKAVLPTPQPRVDRVAPVKEEKDPGEAKREAVAPPPPPRPETAPEVRPEETKVASAPPAPPVRPEPPKPEPPKVEPVKAEPPTPAPRPPLRPAAPEVPEPEAEPVRAAKAEAPKKVESKEETKPEPKKVAKVEPKSEPPKPEAKAEPKPQPPKADPVKEALKRDDILKALASAKEKAPEAKPARPKVESAETSYDSDAIRRKLLASKEPAAATGSTGERVQRQASLGTATGSAPKLSMSDREALGALLVEQINRCWSLSGAQIPPVKPLVKMSLSPDGKLTAQPVLTNVNNDPAFRALAESGMRAIRQCAPYNIPSRYAASHADWSTINVRLNPSDLL